MLMEEIHFGDCGTHMNGYMCLRKSNAKLIIEQPWKKIAFNLYKDIKSAKNM